MRRLLLSLLFAAVSAGCARATLQASLVPNPVLLGPVDRVGGHRVTDTETRTVGRIESEVNDFVSVITEKQDVGRSEVVTRTTTASHAGSDIITKDVLVGTEGRPERDVRVDAVPMGAWAMISTNSGMAERWVGLRARVVEVRRER